MEQSNNPSAQHYEIQHLLIALNPFGKDFGHNRDTYYSLGRYLGYIDLSLSNRISKRPSFMDTL